MAFIDTSIVRDKRNEVFSEVEKVWKLVEEAIGEKPYPEIVYTMRDGDKVPDRNQNGKPWGRVTMNHTDARQTSISGRRYTNRGDFIFELFVRTSATDSGKKIELLADFIKLWFRNYRGSVILKNIGIQTRPNNSGYSSAAIVAAFEYYEVNSGKNPS